MNRSEGVQKAEVDFESQKATVSYNASQLDETRIKQLIESVGDGKSYKVVTGE
ncbi:heavy metal-associated domain-containing protein [Capnocytophaga canimorsus]|nr:heavy metal-associated domain-containing protein [Capnocytophaga canimorsus]WGU69714.1 heavy metal-associated domain-containing protein [Capnocytophaga canimorsus]